LENADFQLLKEESEIASSSFSRFPETVAFRGAELRPHRIDDISNVRLPEGFHRFITITGLLSLTPDFPKARLGLCLAFKDCYRQWLQVLGISAPEKKCKQRVDNDVIYF